MTLHIVIYGQVQGVFFRSSAKDEADRLGLVGWIRNDRDGSVEVMAVGTRTNLDKFLAWCKKGPPFAKVENVEIDWQEAQDLFDSFDIL